MALQGWLVPDSIEVGYGYIEGSHLDFPTYTVGLVYHLKPREVVTATERQRLIDENRRLLLQELEASEGQTLAPDPIADGIRWGELEVGGTAAGIIALVGAAVYFVKRRSVPTGAE